MHNQGPEGPQQDADGGEEPATGSTDDAHLPADGSADDAHLPADVPRTSIKDRLADTDTDRSSTEEVDDLRGSDAPTVLTAASGEATDPDDQDGMVTPKKKPPRKNRRLAKAGIWIGVVVVLLAGAYVGSAYFLAERVPADTTVAGVDISGLSSEQAQDVLVEELGGLESEPLPLAFEDAGAEIEPGSAGLSFDAPATVARFTGFTLDPQILLGHIFGLGEREPVTQVDSETLEAALESLAQDLDINPVEGSITIADAAAEITEPENGSAVDIEAAVELLTEEWITGQRPLDLPAQVVEPEIGPEEIQAAMDDIVDPFLSGPVIVAINDTEIELTTAELADAASLEVNGTEFSLVLDDQELAEVLTGKEDSIGETPSDARIELQGGEPTIIPAVTGTGLDPAEVGSAVQEASLRTEADERVAELELSQTEAEFTTEDAEALGVVEVIGRYSTSMPHDPPRTENLQIGTSRINNTLIMPGERFSLLEALSPISVAGGYNSSGVVVDGFATEAAGGGLSQLSTTVFNAAFEAGLEDVTHQPHSRWFSRYPEGREATLFSPDLDMIFANNTDYGVLIQSWVGDGQTHVVLWGTDVWDVNITTGARYNITSPQTVYNQNPRCQPESGGQSGFSVQYTRTVSAGGAVQDEQTYTHTYRPWNRVVCGPPPSASDDSGDNGDADDADSADDD